MSVRLVYKDIAVGAEEDASVSTTAAQPFSEVSQIPHGVDSEPIVTLELNSWLLGGKRKLLRGQKVGFWSEALSGPDGVFETTPALLVEFSKQYTSLGVSLVFDTATGEYCSQVTVRWYQGVELLHQQTYHPNGVNYFCAATVEHYNRVEIRLDATALPQCYAKLSRVLFGIVREFGPEELRSAAIVQQIDPISSSLEANSLAFDLDSDAGVEYLFQRLQPIFAYDNQTLVGVFFVDSSVRSSLSLYKVRSSDAVGVLSNETIPAAMYTQANARSVIEAILDGKFDLDLDPTLESESLTGFVDEGTRRDALHQVAFALRAVVDTSGSEAVRVYRPAMSDAVEIPSYRTYVGGSVSTKAVVTAVRVTAHSYGTAKVDGAEQVQVGGVTWYDTQTVTTITNPNITPSDKQNVVEITDATLVNPDNVEEVAQHVYDYHMRRSTHNVKLVVAGEKPGDYVTTHTPWGSTVTGTVTTMRLKLSGITAAECEVVGV